MRLPCQAVPTVLPLDTPRGMIEPSLDGIPNPSSTPFEILNPYSCTREIRLRRNDLSNTRIRSALGASILSGTMLVAACAPNPQQTSEAERLPAQQHGLPMANAQTPDAPFRTSETALKAEIQATAQTIHPTSTPDTLSMLADIRASRDPAAKRALMMQYLEAVQTMPPSETRRAINHLGAPVR
jgi:hypothetical protein